MVPSRTTLVLERILLLIAIVCFVLFFGWASVNAQDDGFCEGITSLKWTVVIRGTPSIPGQVTNYTVTDPAGLQAFLGWNVGEDAYYQDPHGYGHLYGLTDEQYNAGKWYTLFGYGEGDAIYNPLCVVMIKLSDAQPTLMYPARWSRERWNAEGDLRNHPDHRWLMLDRLFLGQLTEYATAEVIR